MKNAPKLDADVLIAMLLISGLVVLAAIAIICDAIVKVHA